ncbi:hypothetical protein FOZ62_017991, partial [Perkinsus olseni]
AHRLYSAVNLSSSVSYENFFRQSNLVGVVADCLCGTLAIGPAGSQEASDFADYLEKRIDSIMGDESPQTICGGAPLLMTTTSISDPSSYVTSTSYGSSSHPKICYYIEVGKEDEVTIMSNATISDAWSSSDLSDYTSYWYAENGDYPHGDPTDNGLNYYNSLDFPPLMATWMDYRRGSEVPVAALYPMPYPSYRERNSGTTMKQI